MWKTIETLLIVAAFGFGFSWYQLSNPLFLTAAFSCVGLIALMKGVKAIFTRHVEIRRGRRRYSAYVETYTGLAATLKGAQYMLLGFLLLGWPLLIGIDRHSDIFLQFVRRPGLPLIVFGMLCLLQAVIALLGTEQSKRGTDTAVLVSLVLERLYPGIPLLILGVALIGLGMFEIVAPAAFDAHGGAFFESLYGLK